MSVFPNCRENKVNGNYTRTKKLKLQYKVAAKLPSKSDSAIYPAGIFFSSLLFCTIFFVSHPPVHELIFLVLSLPPPPPPPITFLMVRP